MLFSQTFTLLDITGVCFVGVYTFLLFACISHLNDHMYLCQFNVIHGKKLNIRYGMKHIEFALFMCVILRNIMLIDGILAIPDQ